MLDIKYIREHHGEVLARLGRRIESGSIIKILLMNDAKHRDYQRKIQEAHARRNYLSGEIGKLARQVPFGESDPVIENMKAEVVKVKTSIEELTPLAEDAANTVSFLLDKIPNLPLKGVPIGADEEHNVELRKVGRKPNFDFTPKEHFDIGAPLGMDFETAVRMSGSRFAVLRGQMARLERALGQYMLDFHTKWNGFTEVAPPLLVNAPAMRGTGQLPKFEEDLFKTTGGHYLIPTAEVSITNMVGGQILLEEKLPLRYTALTPCFRAEAGSAGRDTRGLIRQHQFNKVELVSITTEEQAEEEHEHMVLSVENLLKSLGLAYRLMFLCTGDMGFSSAKTYDVEVWLPGQNAYREISSISYCGDFQARRMEARYRPEGEAKGTKFVHTLNGSGVAVGRALVAILENYQNSDGTVTIPDALVSYMGGQKVLE